MIVVATPMTRNWDGQLWKHLKCTECEQEWFANPAMQENYLEVGLCPYCHAPIDHNN